jgi:hypothetical protein
MVYQGVKVKRCSRIFTFYVIVFWGVSGLQLWATISHYQPKVSCATQTNPSFLSSGAVPNL